MLRRINYVVRACTDVISSDVSMNGHIWEPIEGEEVTPGQRALVDYIDDLLARPNPQTTEHDLVEGLALDLLIGADAYLEVVYDIIRNAETMEEIERRPSQFWNIDGSTMFIIPEDATGRLPDPPAAAYQQQVPAGMEDFTRNEVIHISDGDVSGRFYGTPRLLSAVLLIGTMQKALKYNYMTFRGQRYPKSLVSVGQLLQPGDIDRITAQMEQQAQENPNGIGIIDSPDLKSLRLIDSNRDMEFMAMTKYIERSICAVFRVPPIKIGISETGGAGIVVGHTQMVTYWDNVEGLQRQIAESLNQFFYDHLGLRAWKLKFKSGRPPLYNEQAVIEDLRIKNGSMTINEARIEHGLDPVPWGDAPPATAPVAFSLDDEGAQSAESVSRGQRVIWKNVAPIERPSKLPAIFDMIRNADESGVSGTGKVLEGIVFEDGSTVIHWCVKDQPNSTTYFESFEAFCAIHIDQHPTNKTEIIWRNKSIRKDVAPGRMQDSPLVDPEAQTVQQKTRSRLAGSWMRARARLLEVLDERLASQKGLHVQKQDPVLTETDLAALLDDVLATWQTEADEVLAEGNADAYADGRSQIRESLEVQDQTTPFGKQDAESLQAINQAFAREPIHSFRAEQSQLIQQTIAQAYSQGDVDLFQIRSQIEQQTSQFTDKETWMLDRIARTSVHQANSEAKVRALNDSGINEVKFISSRDGRVRRTHRDADRRGVIPLQEAQRLLREINCRCQIVKPTRRPETVPSPDVLAQAILEEGVDARTAARASLEAI